jgi:ATP-dependent helicase/DNAse subunit B
MLIEKIPKTISYSSMITYHNCPRLYYINYILGIKKYESTVYTIYGKLVHKYCQEILLSKISKEDAIKIFTKTWSKFCKLYKKNLEKDLDLNELKTCGIVILENIQQAFIDQFGICKASNAEENLYCKIDKYPQKFSGYIDLILGN